MLHSPILLLKQSELITPPGAAKRENIESKHLVVTTERRSPPSCSFIREYVMVKWSKVSRNSWPSSRCRCSLIRRVFVILHNSSFHPNIETTAVGLHLKVNLRHSSDAPHHHERLSGWVDGWSCSGLFPSRTRCRSSSGFVHGHL